MCRECLNKGKRERRCEDGDGGGRMTEPKLRKQVKTPPPMDLQLFNSWPSGSAL